MNSTARGFWVYILQNPTGRFYIGQTDDIAQRLADHNTELASKTFTHKTGPRTDRLRDFARGRIELDSSGAVIDFTDESRSQGWDLDALGNMNVVTTDGTGQGRMHDAQNRITSVSGQSAPAYDANGNLTNDGVSTYEYDAWNRLARAQVNGKWFPYEYDALGRRIVEGSNPGTGDFINESTHVHLYYNANWQVVQETNYREDGLSGTYDTTVSQLRPKGFAKEFERSSGNEWSSS